MSTTTSAPHPPHFSVIVAPASSAISSAPPAITVPYEVVDALAEAELLLDARLLPLVAAEEADQHPGRAAQPYVGRTALGTAVDAVGQRLVDRLDVGTGLRLGAGSRELLLQGQRWAVEGGRVGVPGRLGLPLWFTLGFLAHLRDPSAFAFAAS